VVQNEGETMQIAIISTFLGIVLFLCLLLGFRYGLRLGMQASQGKTPEPIKPVQAVTRVMQEVKESKEVAEANKAFSDGFQSIMSYTGDKEVK
jgi:hypothetical protein